MKLDFVHVFFVELRLDLVLLMIIVRIIFFVDTKIVQPHLVTMMLIAVVKINSRVHIIQMVISIIMKKPGS